MSTLSGMLSESAPEWISPDRAIAQAATETLMAKSGGLVSATIARTFQGLVQQQARSYLQETAPNWVFSMPEKLASVDGFLGAVDVESSLLVAPRALGDYEATEMWDSLAVFSSPACRDSGGIGCDQTRISLQELADSEYPLDVVSASYTSIDTGQALEMHAHDVSFNYGRLGLYLLTNLVLPPEPTQGLSLRNVTLAAINCRGLAGRLGGQDTFFGVDVAGVEVGLDLNDLVGSCEDGVFGMVNGFVDRFSVPVSMNLSGRVLTDDSDHDGTVDQLTQGELDGQITAQLLSSNTREGPVDAYFTGFRVGELPQDFGGNTAEPSVIEPEPAQAPATLDF